MYEALERRSKERSIVASLAKLAADKTIGDENFESEKAAKQMAEAIRKDSKNDNLVYKLEADGEAHLARGLQPFAKWRDAADGGGSDAVA